MMELARLVLVYFSLYTALARAAHPEPSRSRHTRLFVYPTDDNEVQTPVQLVHANNASASGINAQLPGSYIELLCAGTAVLAQDSVLNVNSTDNWPWPSRHHSLPKLSKGDMQKAAVFVSQFAVSMADTHSVAIFFGPGNVGSTELQGAGDALVGIGSVVLDWFQTESLAPLKHQIRHDLETTNDSFDELACEVAELKKSVFSGPLGHLFAHPEQVLLTFRSVMNNVFNGLAGSDYLVEMLRSYVDQGAFSSSFAFIRNCISGHDESCVSEDKSLLAQVGEALNNRPSQVGKFFAYYQMLLVAATQAFCTYTLALATDDQTTCDMEYAATLPDYAAVITEYYTQTIRCKEFLCAMGEGLIPSVLASIVQKYPNEGLTGARAIRSAFETELNAFYNDPGWYDYYEISISVGSSRYKVLNYPSDEEKIWGAAGYVMGYYGYNIVYAFVPSPDGPMHYRASLAPQFRDCVSLPDAQQMEDCVDGASPQFWYSVTYVAAGSWFYTNVWGGKIPGGICSDPDGCHSPQSIAQISWISPDNKKFILIG